MATDTVSLPKGFVLDSQEVSAPVGFTIDKPDIEVTPGVPIPQEDLEAFAVRQFEDEYSLARRKRGLQTNVIKNLPRKDRGTQIIQMKPEHLLEAISDLNPVTEHSTRRDMVKMLKARGLTDKAIEDFVLEDRGPQGVSGFLKKQAIPTGAEIIGGAIGAKGGKPIRGAIAGRAIGETIQRAGERAFITERTKGLGQDIKEGAIESSIAGVGEYGSRKIVGIGAALLKPAGKTKIAGIDDLQATLREAGERVTAENIPDTASGLVDLKPGGVGLKDPAIFSPGEATNQRLFGTLDNVSEKALTSMQRIARSRAGKITAFDVATKDVLATFSDDLIEQLTPAQLGGFLNDAINGDGGALEAARGIYRGFYSQLDDLGVGTVSNKQAKKIADKLLKQVSEGGLLKGSDEGAAFVANVAGLADEGTFQQAITNRSQLFELARKFDKSGDRSAARLARELGQSMDDAMQKAASAHSPEALKLWRRGNATFKGVHKRFDAEVIGKLAKEVADKPELVAQTIFKNKQPTRINQVKKILLSPSGKTAKQVAEGKETWAQLQNSFVQSMFNKASTLEDGIVFGKNLQKAIKNFGTEAMEATFSPQQVKNLEEIARLGTVVQGKIKGEGGMFIQLAQPAAVAGAVAGKGKGRLAAMAILTTPPVWSRLALDQTGLPFSTSKLLIDGLIDIDKEGIKANTAVIQKLMRVYFTERDKYITEQTEIERKARVERASKESLKRKQSQGLGTTFGRNL